MNDKHSLEHLPTEIMEKILNNLYKSCILSCCLVSKHFAELCTPYLWKSLTVSSFDKDLKKMNRSKYIKYILYLEFSTKSKLNGAQRFIQSCANVLSLNFDFPSLNDSDIWVISTNLKYLQHLSFVSDPSTPSVCITDEGLIALSRNCKNLKNLFIHSKKTGILDEITGRIIPVFNYMGIESLFTLKLKGFGFCFVGDSMNLFSFQQEDLEKLVIHISKLITMNSLVELRLDWPQTTDLILEQIIEFQSFELKSLHLGHCTKINTVSLFLKNNPFLISFSFNDSSYRFKISQAIETWINLFSTEQDSKCPDIPLKRLVLSNVSDCEVLWPLIPYFKLLTHLKIITTSQHASISYPGREFIISNALRNIPFLQNLDAQLYSNDSLTALSLCKNLEVLNIQSASPWLSLSILIKSTISDEYLIILVRSCPKINALYLDTASLISDISIIFIAKQLGSQLSHLAIPLYTTNIGEKSIEALSIYASNLVELLNIPLNTVSFEHLIEFIPRFQRLFKMSLNGALNKEMTLEKINALKGISKNLKFIGQTF